MKKLYPLLSVLFLIYWSCADEVEEEQDTTPPTVAISSHSPGQTVNETITITVTTQDNEGISKVEFFHFILIRSPKSNKITENGVDVKKVLRIEPFVEIWDKEKKEWVISKS